MIDKVTEKNIDLGFLLTRVGLALVFITHGWSKIGDMDGTIAFFSLLKLSPVWAYIVAYSELLAGMAMLLGVFTSWAGVVLAVTMIVSISILKISKGFLGGYEFDLLLFLSALAVIFTGPGKYTIKTLWKKM